MHRNGKVVRVTALVVTGDVEACLLSPQWWPGQSSWPPFHFCVIDTWLHYVEAASTGPLGTYDKMLCEITEPLWYVVLMSIFVHIWHRFILTGTTTTAYSGSCRAGETWSSQGSELLLWEELSGPEHLLVEKWRRLNILYFHLWDSYS